MHTHTIEEMLKALRPVLKDKNRAKQLLERYWSDKIALIWDVEDVFRAANEIEIALTRKEAVEVLDTMLSGHNAQYGLKWEDITNHIQEHVLGRELSKREVHQFVHNDIITINKK